MKIFDENKKEIQNPDLEKGYLKEDKLFVKHHDPIKEILEQGHYEVIAEYPNGGKDVEWVIDVKGVEAQEAWDEYEDIYIYTLYTEEELAERNKPTDSERITALEEALRMILSGVIE